ncbi:MAG: hypothetical protein Q8K24_05855 [Hydrogenophaga sp.]|nr:hypothetical protein [Hydrogenophaga sp.]
MPQFQMAPNLTHNIRKNCAIFNAVYAAYMEAVYWTDTGESEQPAADCEMAQHAQFVAVSDVADFLALCADNGTLEQYADRQAVDWQQFGIDFWLTRNGHGAGFWDRGLSELGDKLSESAKSMGGRDIYQGDDGLIYFA